MREHVDIPYAFALGIPVIKIISHDLLPDSCFYGQSSLSLCNEVLHLASL